MMNRDDLRLLFEVVVGMIVGIITSLPTTVLALLVLQVADILTGMMSGYITKSLDSRVSYVGLMRKVIVLIAVAASGYLGAALRLPGAEILPTGIAGFYAMHEGLSILENLTKAGVPLPAQLKAALVQEQESRRGDV